MVVRRPEPVLGRHPGEYLRRPHEVIMGIAVDDHPVVADGHSGLETSQPVRVPPIDAEPCGTSDGRINDRGEVKRTMPG